MSVFKNQTKIGIDVQPSRQMTALFKIAFLGIDHPHGAGWRDLLTNFDDEVEITALVPGFEGGTTSLEERNAQLPRFDSVDELIAQGDFDGAMVCLPNNQAPQVVQRLAQAGKHVLVEKPFTGSAAQARPALEAIEKSGVAFQSGFMWRYDEGAHRLRDMIRDGRFGKLISLEMTFVNSDVKRRDPDHYLFDPEISQGGYFSWLACHYLDLLLYVTGEQVVGVTARTGIFGSTPTEVEDGGIALLDLSGGGIATFIGGYWMPRWAGEAHWTLRGSERWVHWQPDRKLEIHGPQPQWYAMEECFEFEPKPVKGYGGIRNLQIVSDWIRQARGGSESCRNTPQSMLQTLELIDTIYLSSKEGRRIECSIGEPAL